MTRTRRTARSTARRCPRTVCLRLEALESRDQPSQPSAPFDMSWLDLRLDLWQQAPSAESLDRLRRLLDQATASAVTGHAGTPSVVSVTPAAPVAQATVAIAHASDAALLITAASVAATPAQPQLASITINTSADGLAHPQPGYRVVTLGGGPDTAGPGNILYATYLGTALAEEVRALAVDGGGNMYVAGTIDSGDPDRGFEAFVAKMSPAGQLVYGVIFGGLGRDEANGVDVDAQGNAYVGGTFTNEFGATHPYVLKLNPEGNQVLWRNNLLLPRPDGNVVGITDLRFHSSTNRVYYSVYVTAPRGTAGGVGRVNASNGSFINGLVYIAFGISGNDGISTALGLDQAGNSYLSILHINHDTGDADWRLLRVGTTMQLDWSQLYQAAGQDVPLDLTADAAGNSYAVGTFTTANGVALGLMKHNPAGQLIYRLTSPVIDGSLYTVAATIAIDDQGRAYVSGFYLTPRGDAEVFLTRITARPAGGGFEFDLDTFSFGGSGHDGGLALGIVNNPGPPPYAVVAGGTDSADFPVTPGAYQTEYGGGVSDGFLARTRLPGA